MPVEPEHWDGVKTAMAYGYVSPLLTNPIPEFELTVPHRFWPEGEDCLNLNIATPTLDAHTGSPNTEGLPQWNCADESHVPTMVFDETIEAKVDFDDGLIACINEVTPPFSFRAAKPKDDEQEGHAWKY